MERCLLPKTGEEGSGLWEKASLRWFLYRVLQKLPDDEDFRPLVLYTKQDPLRTLQLADLLAELFDEYVLFRPEKILAWEKGSAL